MNKFLVNGNTAISFSGGRTSAYMLWRVLEANNGLPDNCEVCFANTGKEAEATLEFVQECSDRWNVPITWVEYRNNEQGFKIVDFDTASRDGQPFEEIIRKRNYLPNPVTRFCTVELKIRVIAKYMKSLCWFGDGVDMMIGIRGDESRRVSKIRNADGHNPESKHITNLVPLADAGVTVTDVGAFWDAQPFNLRLPTYKGRTLAGNCDLCFLKPASQVASLIAEKPARADFWIRMEALALASKPSGAVFRSDRPSYAQMLKYSQQQGDMFDPTVSGIECFCGD
jgi:3'-phosphoadenosine 5'-phosphosulfate sulfotransferase (PAPS reductase)/FAD synthetase